MKRFLAGILVQIVAVGLSMLLKRIDSPSWLTLITFLVLMAIASYLMFSQFYKYRKEMRDLQSKSEQERRQAQLIHEQQTRQIDNLRAQGRFKEADQQALNYIDELMRGTKQT